MRWLRCYPRTGQHSQVNQEDGHVLRGIVHQPIGDEKERERAERTAQGERQTPRTQPDRPKPESEAPRRPEREPELEPV